MSLGYYQIFLGRSVKLPLLENLPYIIDKQGVQRPHGDFHYGRERIFLAGSSK